MHRAFGNRLGWIGILAWLASCSSPRVSVSDNGTVLVVAGPGVSLKLDKKPFAFTWETSSTTVRGSAPDLFFSKDGQRVGVDSVKGFTRTGDEITLQLNSASGVASLKVSFPLDGVVRLEFTPPEAAADAAGARLQSPSDEAIYGLLERIDPDIVKSEYMPQEVGSLDRRGLKIPMRVMNSLALYTPFFQTSRRFGFYVEGTSIGSYDLAAAEPEVIEIEFEMPPGVQSWAFLLIDGPTPDRILDRYTAITGRPFLPPQWVFKHWRWRDEHRSAAPATLDGIEMNADLVDDVQHYQDLDIPAGNYTFDRPWATGDLPGLTEPEEPGFGDLAWDEVRFPNPQAMIAALNTRGYHVLLWLGPWATGVDSNREAREQGFLAPNSSYLIDFTNPEVASWWSGKIKPLLDMGIAGFKLDRGDEDTPEQITDVYFDGRTGREIRNAYPVLFAKLHHDITRAVRGDDFLVYPRAGYAGSQRWAVFSAGDIPGTDMIGQPTDLGLRSAILAVQYNAFNGFPIWGSDTGGYAQFGDREVFARWLEFSAFCPIMEIGGVGTHAPWDMPTNPQNDTEMIDIYRHYVKIHHALVPYSFRHAQEANRSGRPIAKPLLFDYPDDPKVKNLWEEFLYGDDLLVTPVWKVGARAQKVYLPKGSWVDFWDRTRVLEGPVETNEPAPLDRLPIFVREGAAVLQDLPAP